MSMHDEVKMWEEIFKNPEKYSWKGFPVSRIPDFIESLRKMEEVHLKKNEDYASNENPFSNFDISEYLISLFSNNRDKTFVWPIGTKLARLASLLSSGRVPNNESIDDSFIDIANYVLLWKADYVRRLSSQPNTPNQQEPKI